MRSTLEDVHSMEGLERILAEALLARVGAGAVRRDMKDQHERSYATQDTTGGDNACALHHFERDTF